MRDSCPEHGRYNAGCSHCFRAMFAKRDADPTLDCSQFAGPNEAMTAAREQRLPFWLKIGKERFWIYDKDKLADFERGVRFATSELWKEKSATFRNDHQTVAMIKRMVADYFNVPLASMSQRTRGRNTVCFPRQIAMALTLEFTHLTQVAVGQVFGGRDHVTATYAADAVERRMGEDKVSKAVQALRGQIKAKLAV